MSNDEFGNYQAGKSGGGPSFTGDALQNQRNAFAHAQGKREKDSDDHFRRVNEARRQKIKEAKKDAARVKVESGLRSSRPQTGYAPVKTQYRQGFIAALLSLLILPLRIIVGLCVLPFFAYLGAMVITKGTRIMDNPFSGPPWYHTLGLAALGGIGIAFIATKLAEWIEDL